MLFIEEEGAARHALRRIAMNAHNTTVGVSLRLMGDDLCISQITEILGVCPSKTWNKGDYIGNTGKRHTYTAWIYDIEPIETLDMHSLIKR